MADGLFSAWLIGENSLVTECALVLRENGHQVHGIVSPEASVRAAAAAQGFRVVELGPDLPRVLAGQPFDYLFSVVNLRMLPSSVLCLPRRLAINFHDALLPARAGVFASAWAVAYGADQHGVTWHVMTEEADTGDILVQREFGLDEAATSQSVNLDCWRAGLDSFRELVTELAAGAELRRPQDLTLRSYHGRADRPAGGLVLSWWRTAAEICALVRACDFGPNPNAFGAAKVLLPDGTCGLVRSCVPVGGAVAAAPRTAATAAPRTAATAAPGTVVAVDGAGMTVMAADGPVRLTGFAGLDGTELSLAGMDAGMTLPEPDGSLAGPESDAVKTEAYWVRRLTAMRPLELSFAGPGRGEPRWRSHSVALPAWAGAQADPAVTVAGAVLAYLGQVTGESGFDVGLRLPAAGPLLAEVVPVRDGAGDFARQIADATRRGPYLCDVAARYPDLAGRSLIPPVVLDLTVSPEPVAGAAIVVRVFAGGGCVLVIDESAVPPTIALSLAGGFAEFLARLPEDGPGRAPLVSPAELHWQSATCNATSEDYPDARVYDLFAERVRSCPGRVALSCDGERLTYADLAERSGRLASYLAVRGAGPGARVGVYLDRSADLLVTLLAVLRTGAAYVPLDPVYPAARVGYMLEDAEVALLVTQSDLAHNAASGSVVIIDQCRDEIRLSPAARPAPAVTGDDLAYVIYTSGSTGQPKGVQVTHRGLTNFLCSMARQPGYTAGTTLLAVTTVCFDIAALELFLPLISGGTVELAPAGAVGDGAALRRLLDRVRPAVLQATPVTWKMLIAAGWDGDGALTALCGGEALPRDLAGDLLTRAGSVWNLYGPTETTIWSTVWRVRPGEKVSIGLPVANTSCHVLDASMRVVPEGIGGELYIGGDGVAAGYRNRPELTAERFVPCPPGLGAGTLYRTGDLVRRGNDGRLYYLSRADNQVKLHGHRIEPGEIEAALRDYPAVKDAVVVIRDERLVAYLIADGALDALPAFLRSRLPGYMVPAQFTAVDAFPQTPNGKMDRKALPGPGPGPGAGPGVGADVGVAGPGGADLAGPGDADLAGLTCGSEQAVLGAVQAYAAALLGGPVRADRRFSDLGVDSVAAVGLAQRLTQLTGQPLSAIAVFEHPTPSALAAWLWRQLSGAVPEVSGPDLVAAAVLPSGICPSAAVPDPMHVVLTGATGFVGAFLLRELVSATGATVHCVVRAADHATAAKRVQRTLEEYGLWSDQLAGRLRAWAGDLTKPLLGLTRSEFDRLALAADAVYHAGAQVNAILPYLELSAANVGGTREALALAARQRPSAFHHISTIEVFARAGLHDEDGPAGPPDALRGGYAQTKWVAEQLVRQAADRGLATAIYRLPRILGDTRTGACQTRDLLWQVIKGCVQAGAVPAGVAATFQLAPADWAASAIVALSRTAAGSGAAYHVTGPDRIGFGVLSGYLRAAGYRLAEHPVDQWASMLRGQPGNAAAPGLAVFLAELTGHGLSKVSLATAATIRALNDGGAAATCPQLTPDLFATYLRYFTGTGYLPAPG